MIIYQIHEYSGELDEAFVNFSNPQEWLGHIDPPKKVKLTTGCTLCDKIWSSKEAYQNFIGDHWEEEIVIAMEDDKPYLYIPIEMDNYYSDTYLQINYCPKCGRRLIEE